MRNTVRASNFFGFHALGAGVANISPFLTDRPVYFEGTKVRYDPEWVAINTPSTFRSVTGPKGNNKKARFYNLWTRKHDAPSTMQTTENGPHGRKRRVLSNAFSDRALRSLEPFVVANLERWCELLGNEIPGNGGWSESVNMADWLNWFVFDVMGDLCLGKSFGMKEKDSDMRYIIHLMADTMEFLYHVSCRIALSLLV